MRRSALALPDHSDESIDRDRLLDKLRAILALRDGATNPHEARVAAAAAARLISRFMLTEAEARESRDKPIIGEVTIDLRSLHVWDRRKPIPAPPKDRQCDEWLDWYNKWGEKARHWRPTPVPEHGLRVWCLAIAHSITELTQTVMPAGGPHSLLFIGRQSQVELAAFLFSNIYSRMQQTADQAMADYVALRKRCGVNAWGLPGDEHPRHVREAFCSGMGIQIARGLLDERLRSDPVEETPDSQALVPLHTAIQAYVDDHYGWLSTRRQIEPGDLTNPFGHGYYSGRAAGEVFELQQGLASGTSTARPLIAAPG